MQTLYNLYIFCSPLVYIDPLNYNMAYLFTELFEDALNEYAYNAGLAGLGYSLTNTRVGFLVGYLKRIFSFMFARYINLNYVRIRI